MRLSEYTEAVAYDTAFWLTAFTNPDYPVAQLGQACVVSAASCARWPASRC